MSRRPGGSAGIAAQEIVSSDSAPIRRFDPRPRYDGRAALAALQNIQPWRDQLTKAYDLVIIGTGTAAMVASQRTAAAGWKVAVIDFRPFGGTCALRGCDPKKMLIGGARAIDHVQRMKGKGPEGQVRLNWPELIAFKRGFTDPVPAKNERSYAEKGIETFHGRARFTGQNTVEVAGETLEARHILIAAGAEPIKLGIPGE